MRKLISLMLALILVLFLFPISIHATTPEYQMISTYSSGWSQNGGTTQYYTVIGDLDYNSSEAPVQTLIRDTYTISLLKVYVVSNTTGGNTVVTARKNGRDETLTITIPTGETGYFTDSTHHVDLVDGDLYCIKIVSGAGGAIVLSSIAQIYTGTSSIQQVSYAPGTSSMVYTTSRIPVNGYLVPSDYAEIRSQFKVNTSVTYSNLRVYVTKNVDCGGTTYIRLRINGANGNQVIAIPSDAGTGSFEDTTHSDVIPAGALINYQVVVPSTPSNFGISLIQMKAVSAMQVNVVNTYNLVLDPGTTSYLCHTGNMGGRTTVEASAKVDLQTSAIIKNMGVYVNYNTLNVAATVKLRVNGADSAVVVTIPAEADGYIEDTVHTVSVEAGDLIDYEVNIPAGTGSLWLNIIGTEIGLASTVSVNCIFFAGD